jgi:hypothetical protein
MTNKFRAFEPMPLDDWPKENPCQLCTRFNNDQCDILGLVTPAKLEICKDAGYSNFPVRARFTSPVRHFVQAKPCP